MNYAVIGAIASGGAVGSVLRYAVYAASLRILPNGWPWGTFLVNIIGGLIVGFILSLLALRGDDQSAWRAFLVVGLLGGFTTFSSFSIDVVNFINRGELIQAVTYASSSVAISVLAAMAGIWAAEYFTA